MKKFEVPAIEIMVFAVEDVITVSGGAHDNSYTPGKDYA